MEKNETKPLTIRVFITHNDNQGNARWQGLPATSSFLNSIQFVPTSGDFVVTLKEDWPLLELDAEVGPFSTVLVVERRITPYFNGDVAVICRLREETDPTMHESTW